MLYNRGMSEVPVFLFILSIYVPFTKHFQFFVEKEDKNGEIRRELQIDPHLRCVPFRQCSAFMWILANTRKIRNINAAKLFQIAEKKMCDVDELVLNSNLTLDSRIA